MIRPKSVFEVVCDRCEDRLGYRDEGCAWNFDTRQDAVAELVECGWVQTGDRSLCGRCVGFEACGLLGLAWAWEPPSEGGFARLDPPGEWVLPLFPDTEGKE